MNINVISGKDLTQEHMRLWSQFQQTNPILASPFFCAEFASKVAEVRDDIWVGIIEQSGETVGFFPFQRSKYYSGSGLGCGLSDYQGPVMKPGIELDGLELVRGCGLKIWDFHNLLNSQVGFDRFQVYTEESAIINLMDGYEVYEAEQKARSNWIQQTSRKMRKFEREVGELRFEVHSGDVSLLRLMMAWKSEHYARLGTYDRFEIDWMVKLVECIHQTQTENFAGMLSVLYVGDEVAALHFGMRSQTIWHYWFPTYNSKFHPYSPGYILLLKMMQSANSLGIGIIDLGTGDEAYKPRVMNSTVPAFGGSVQVPSLIVAAKWLKHKLVTGV